MAKSKLVKANDKIAEGVVNGYKKIEEGVVKGYKKIENAFVDRYLTHDGESVEDAKKRIAEQINNVQEGKYMQKIIAGVVAGAVAVAAVAGVIIKKKKK